MPLKNLYPCRNCGKRPRKIFKGDLVFCSRCDIAPNTPVSLWNEQNDTLIVRTLLKREKEIKMLKKSLTIIN